MLKNTAFKIRESVQRLVRESFNYTMNFKIVFCSLFSFASFAQTVSYDDVGVIVNDNSQASIDIANYFQSARNIPAQNMIHISAPTTELIDSLQFEQIRAQIESYLISNSLVDSLNYLVTTKGVPLKFGGINCVQNPSNSTCGSFDSELTLLLGPNSSGIGSYGSVLNPYYNQTTNFSRDMYGLYLVSRLDGYSKEDVFNLIDHSGAKTGVNQQSGNAIIDLNMATGGDSAYFVNMNLQPAYDTLTINSWNAVLDLNQTPLLNQNDVFAYYTTGHGPINSVDLNYAWTPGSFSSMATCETASTFDSTLNTSNAFLIADLISEGCTAAHGYVNCIYFSQIFEFDIFANRYYDQLNNFNLAESFFMSEKVVSWQSVLIGDPKASVFINNLAEIQPIGNEQIKVYPNPTSGQFKISGISELAGNASLTITGVNGAIIEQDDALQEGKSYQLTTPGVYFVTIFSDGAQIGTYRIIKN